MKYLLRDIKIDKNGDLDCYEPLVQHLLLVRGINKKADAEKFFSKKWECESPYAFEDMEKAVSRFLKAIENNEHITVFSDYDCDGICGASVLHSLFKKLDYENFDIIIPDRHYEGYGLSETHIKSMKEKGTTTLITIDCGITAIGAIQKAKDLNIDTIVIDHHTIQEELPPMYALIHYEKKEGTKTPFCGTALAFKFACGVCEKRRDVIKEGWEKWLLDVVSIATIADMVPQNGENRILTHYGMYVMQKTKRKGLQLLYKKSRLNKASIKEDDIGFTVAPRINAASRMGSAEDAFILLTTDDDKIALEKVELLESLNNKRRGLITSMLKKLRPINKNKSSVRVFGESDFRPSLAGLVAQKLIEELEMPIFVWGRSGTGEIKGSCRCPEGGNLVEIMEKTKHCFKEYGGHSCAGGFTLKEEFLFTIEEELSKSFNNISKQEEVNVNVDGKLKLDMVNNITYKNIRQFAPFGKENEKPLFVFSDLLVDEVIIFGKQNNHTKYILTDGNKKVEAVDFFKKPKVEVGNKVNVYGYLEPTYRNGLMLKIDSIEMDR